jgi:ribonuclease HI/5'-3' exonuclease
MGIKDLSKFIRERSNCYTPLKLSKLYGKKVAVDISVFLYKTIRSVGEDDWLSSIILMLLCLKKNGIKAVLIIDGPNAPPEKLKEREERRKNAGKVKDKAANVIELITEIEALRDSCEEGDSYVPARELRMRVKELCMRQRDTDKYEEVDYRNYNECLIALRDTHEKFAKQCITITRKHSELVMEIGTYLGLAVMQADGEAETMCSYMCIKGLVDAVLTEDSDVLAYGTPLFLCKFDIRSESVVAVDYEDLIYKLDLTSSQFKDFCIMCSCDYNDRIKLPPKKMSTKPNKKQTGIGPKKAYDLLKEHGSIDNIEYMTDYDMTPLNYKRCRVLFTIPNIYDNLILPYNKPLDLPNIEKFLETYNCKHLIHKIKETWRPSTLVFIDGDDGEGEAKDDNEGSKSDNSSNKSNSPNNKKYENNGYDYHIYTDGGCALTEDNKPGGWGVVILNFTERVLEGEVKNRENGVREKELYGGTMNTTNNKMELMAAIKALNFLNNIEKENLKNLRIALYADSRYVQLGITDYMDKWKKRNWENVKNPELWKTLDKLNSKFNIDWFWVKAHSGDYYNEKADGLARIGMLECEDLMNNN